MDRNTKGILLAVAAVAVAGLLAVEVTLWTFARDDTYDFEHWLTIGFMDVVDSLNPYVGVTDASLFFYSLVYDPLVTVDQDLDPVGDLARSWWVVPESDPGMAGMPYGSVWQYNITMNATWSDGETFAADDVVFNLNINAQDPYWMWAFQPYNYFLKEAEKIDNQTVRVSFWDRATGDPKPASFAYMMPIFMLPYHKLQGMTAADIGFHWNGVFYGEEMPIVSTGPFMATEDVYAEWLSGNEITLVKNPSYHWGSDRGRETEIDKVTLRFYDDSSSMKLALTSADIDIAEFPPVAFDSLRDDIESGDLKDMGYYSGPSPNGEFIYVGFNLDDTDDVYHHDNYATCDPAVRTALAMATNKSWIVEDQLFGLGETGSGLVSPIWPKWHYEPSESETIKYDPASAKTLLQEAGYVDIDSDQIREATSNSLAVQMGWVENGTPLTFTMTLQRNHPEERDIVQYLEEEWLEIGVALDWSYVDTSSLCTGGQLCIGEQPDLVLNRLTCDPDPNFILYTQSSAALGGWSDMWYNSTAYDENYSNFISSFDCPQRCALAKECQRIHYLDIGYDVLAYPHQTYIWREDTVTSWGDWEAHPGLSLDSSWGGSAFLFTIDTVTEVACCTEPVLLEGIVVAATAVAFVVLLWGSLRLLRKGAKGGAGPVS